MSGHSQFKNIMYRKGAQDAKRARVFSKIAREITVAVKEGGVDQNSNTRLRSALINARSENMPNDNVERAIKKALGGDAGVDYLAVRYEGYGPGGVAMIVEGLTDNKNRTAPEVRAIFTKFGGSLGETNSVSFQFDHIGCIIYDKSVSTEEDIFETAIDAEASDVVFHEDTVEIVCAMEKMSSLRDCLMEKFGDPKAAGISWRPKNAISISPDTAKVLEKMIDLLEDNDDVQSVVTNCEFPAS
jgi:YebC/PmpR family DNA-binding regulatory protein